MAEKNRETEQSTAALGSQIYEYVLSQIIRVQMVPGERINVAKIAGELGVSRTPIRTALEQLADDGHVIRTSDRGYQVTPVSMQDCFNLCDARRMLEGTAAYMAANNIRAPELETLELSIAGAKECLDRRDYDEFAEYDKLFHETLLRAANNHYLQMVYDTMDIRIQRYRYIISGYCRSTAETDTGHALEKHRCIYLAVKNRYSSVARNEMEEHITYTYRTIFHLSSIIGADSGAAIKK